MNLNDPHIEARTGRAMSDMADEGLTGTYDQPNYGVLRVLTKKLFGLGGKGDVDYVPPDELLKRGKEATDDATAQDRADVAEAIPPEEKVSPDDQVPLEPQDGDTVNQQGEVLPEDTAVTMDPGVEGVRTPEDIAARKQEELERRTWERNINLDYVENPEDIGGVLDAAADLLPAREREALAEIEADPDWKGLKDFLTEKPNANMTSRQLLAGRRMLVSLATEVDDLAMKIVNGDARAETALKFERAQRNMITLQQVMQGQISEAGRTLNSMKIVAQTLNSNDIRAMESMMGKSTMSTKAKADYLLEMQRNNKSPGARIKEMQELSRADRLASIINIRTAGLLTGFRTHAVNAVSNVGMGAWNNLIVYPTAAAISPIRKGVDKLRGREAAQGVSPKEMYVRNAAFMRTVRDSLAMGVRTFKEGWASGDYASSFSGARKVDEIEGGTAPVSEAIGLDKVAESEIPLLSQLAGISKTGVDAYQRGVEALSYGGLSASDEFFKAMAYQQAMTGLAMRQAVSEGLEGDDLFKRTNELLTEPSKRMHETAMLEAERQTFTDRLHKGILGSLNQTAKKISREHPAFRILFPFINTPTSLVNRAYQNSPMAPFTQEFRERISAGGADADLALAQLTAGSTLLLAMYQLYQSGDITGGGPENRKQTKALETLGWQKNSIRVGDTFISYDRLDPFGLTIGAMMDVMDKAAYAETEVEASDIMGALAIGVAVQAVDSTWLQGISELMLVLNNYRDAEKMGVQIASSFVPSIFSQVGDVTRGAEQGMPAKFYPADVWQALEESIVRRVPIAQNQLPPRRYWDGSMVTAGDGEAIYLYNTLSPIRVSSLRKDPLSYELVQNGVPVTAPTSQVPVGGGMRLDLIDDLDNGAQIYDQYLQFVGESRKQVVEALVDSNAYAEATIGPGGERHELLQRALAKGRKIGIQKFSEWADGETFDEETYGPMAKFLNRIDLELLNEAIEYDILTDAERQEALELEAPRVRGREGLPVPELREGR